MIRFPTFKDTPTCAEAKTAASSLREILAKCSSSSGTEQIDRNGDRANSNASSVSSSATNSPSPTRKVKKSRDKVDRTAILESKHQKTPESKSVFSPEMVSSKGEPDNPKLREEVKEEVKNMEKGGGKGSWSAWKAMELGKRYEAKRRRLQAKGR